METKPAKSKSTLQDSINSTAHLPPSGRLMGLDLGTKTIGVAISDGLRLTATPLETIKRKKFTIDADRICEIISENQIAGIILGLPLNMDGSEGAQAKRVRKYAERLRRRLGLPLVYQDERLSSFVADQILATRARKKDRRAANDAIAAAAILQEFLEGTKFSLGREGTAPDNSG